MALCVAAGCGGAASGGAAGGAGRDTEVRFAHRVEWPLALEGVVVTLDDREVLETVNAATAPPPSVLAAPSLEGGEHRVRVRATVSRPCIPGGPRERVTLRASRTVRLGREPARIGIVLRGDAERGLDVRIGTDRRGDRGADTLVATTTDGCGLLGFSRGGG